MQGIRLNSGQSRSTGQPRRYRVLLPPCGHVTRSFGQVLIQCSTGGNFANVGEVRQKMVCIVIQTVVFFFANLQCDVM